MVFFLFDVAKIISDNYKKQAVNENILQVLENQGKKITLRRSNVGVIMLFVVVPSLPACPIFVIKTEPRLPAFSPYALY